MKLGLIISFKQLNFLLCENSEEKLFVFQIFLAFKFVIGTNSNFFLIKLIDKMGHDHLNNEYNESVLRQIDSHVI